MLEHFGDPPSAISVLDFGSGWGRWPRMAAAFGCQAYGADLSSDQTTWAEAQGVTMLDPEQLPAGRFHFVNTEQVFEHLVDPLGTVRGSRRRCVPTACSRSASRTPQISIAGWRAGAGTRPSTRTTRSTSCIPSSI